MSAKEKQIFQGLGFSESGATARSGRIPVAALPGREPEQQGRQVQPVPASAVTYFVPYSSAVQIDWEFPNGDSRLPRKVLRYKLE